MNVNRDAPSLARDSFPSTPTDADRLRDLLARAGLSQRGAATLLGIEERTMRQWCAGQGKPPASVFRALHPRLTHTENLRRMIASNDKIIDALQDGRIVGLGYGPGPASPQSRADEIGRLQMKNEELRSVLRLEEAFQRKQDAWLVLNAHWLPSGDGLQTDASASEAEAAEEEFRAAQSEVDRITAEIRAGKR